MKHIATFKKKYKSHDVDKCLDKIDIFLKYSTSIF